MLVMFPSLCQETRNLVELQQMVKRGNNLLQKKEEQLQQLESSIADEVRAKITYHGSFTGKIKHFYLFSPNQSINQIL